MCIGTRHRVAMPLLDLIAATLAVGCVSDHAPGRTPSFYAEVEVESRPGDPLARFDIGGQRSVIRWWCVAARCLLDCEPSRTHGPHD